MHLRSDHFYFILLLVLIVVLSWKDTYSSFAFIREVLIPEDKADPGFGELSVFRRGGVIHIFIFPKPIELWVKSRILKARLFAFDTDTHRYDFKIDDGKRFVSSLLSGEELVRYKRSGNIPYFVFFQGHLVKKTG